MTSALGSAADEAYGYHLVNLLGSVQVNSDVFDRIVVFDLGLSSHQRELLAALRAVEVRPVPPFVPHWAQGFTWKPWAWTQIEADEIFWLDAGATVLRSLAPALEQIRERGYFVVSQGNELRAIVPPDYFELYGIPARLAARPYVAAGIIGFATRGAFWDRVVLPTYEDCLLGRNLGFSAAEAIGRNRGLGQEQDPVMRDARHFRWDQTVLNAHLAVQLPDAFVNDLDEYAGWRSDHDHPRQVIWSHRRRGSLAYLKRAPYTGPGALRHRAFGASYQLRWWIKLHEMFLQPSSYLRKARKELRRLLR